MENDDDDQILVECLNKAEKVYEDPLLFARENGHPMTFYMIDYDQSVKDKIEAHGGVVIDEGVEIFRNSSVVLGNDSLTNMIPSQERFDKKFIYESINQNRIVNLADYKINHLSKFANYNPTEILFGEKTWDDIEEANEVDEESKSTDYLYQKEISIKDDIWKWGLTITAHQPEDFILEDDVELRGAYCDVGEEATRHEIITEDEALVLGIRYEKSI